MENEISEKYNKRKTNPGRRSQTSKANAEKARQKRLTQLQEQRMFEDYVKHKAQEMMKVKQSVEDPDALYQEYINEKTQPKNKSKNTKPKYPPIEEDEEETESETETSEDEVIYVAPAPRNKKNNKERTTSVSNVDTTNTRELEELKKELEELKKLKDTVKDKPREMNTQMKDEKPNKKNDYLESLRFKILDF